MNINTMVIQYITLILNASDRYGTIHELEWEDVRDVGAITFYDHMHYLVGVLCFYDFSFLEIHSNPLYLEKNFRRIRPDLFTVTHNGG